MRGRAARQLHLPARRTTVRARSSHCTRRSHTPAGGRPPAGRCQGGGPSSARRTSAQPLLPAASLAAPRAPPSRPVAAPPLPLHSQSRQRTARAAPLPQQHRAPPKRPPPLGSQRRAACPPRRRQRCRGSRPSGRQRCLRRDRQGAHRTRTDRTSPSRIRASRPLASWRPSTRRQRPPSGRCSCSRS
eukprot:1384880-Prymnesium_polylepis.2